MKQTTYADPTTLDSDAFDFAKLAVAEKAAVERTAEGAEVAMLDGFLRLVKLIFLFLPGAFAIHFTILALSLFGFADESVGIAIGSFGIFLVSTFMVMLGLGKLSDLKYLRVVGALVAGGVLSAVVYNVLAATTGSDFFGWVALLSLPFNLLLAYLVKLNTDAKE